MLPAPPWLQSLITEEALPSSFKDLALTYLLPLSEQISKWSENSSTPLVVGINGAQGTGKSTICKVLAKSLDHTHQLRCAIISIDDIYLTRTERVQLGNDVHPLFETRGVPGTHDVNMGIDLIKNLKAHKKVALPVFDKSTDDRSPTDQWTTPEQPVDIILFEGWCVGAIAQQEQSLITPFNQLEKNEDPDGIWRRFANQQLRESYTAIFSLLDRLVMLKAPDFECIYEWRKIQEDKLRQKKQGKGIMSAAELARFIMHYERLTRWMFKEMPARVDCLLELNSDHVITNATYQNQLPTH